MRIFLRLALAAGLCVGLWAGPGLAFGAPSAAVRVVGPEAVWEPGPQFVKTVRQKCDTSYAPQFNDCFLSMMQNAAPPPEAVAFARNIGKEGYLSGYRQAGPVGIAHVVYPFRVSDNEGILLVNGSPPVIEVDDFGSLPEKEMKQDPRYLELLKEYPRIALWPGDRSLGASPVSGASETGGTVLDFCYRLRDACRTCKIVGEAHFAFEFDPSGKFLGVRFAGVEKGGGAAAASGGKMKNAQGRMDRNGVFRVRVNQEFKITVDSNPTTGYQWDLAAKPDESVVRFVSKAFVAPESGLVGAGGKEVWTFRAVGRGQTEIRMKYFRSWEKGKAPVRRALYSVTVD